MHAMPAVFRYPPSESGSGSLFSQPLLRELPELIVALRTHIDQGEKSFTVWITSALNKEVSVSDPYLVLSLIMSNLGIMRFSYSMTDEIIRVSLFIEIQQYYAGKHIDICRRNQKLKELSSREKETWEAAQKIISGIHGSDLEKEKQINDYLCNQVEYFTDEDGHNENDCAIGALLNGKADCDGYSDAFYLLGTLCGLDVRYVIGQDIDSFKAKKRDLHMWNLVKMQQQWVMMDNTWNDPNRAPDHNYRYFNMGRQEASFSHAWDSRLFVEKQSSRFTTDLLDSGLVRISVSSLEELKQALPVITENQPQIVYFLQTDNFVLEENKEPIREMIHNAGIKNYYSLFHYGFMELTGIEYSKHMKMCSSEYQAYLYIESLAKEQNTNEFWLGLRNSLSERLLASGNEPLYRLLSSTSLSGYQIDIQSKSVRISRPVWSDAPKLLKCSNDLDTYLTALQASKPQTASFLFSGELSEQLILDMVKELCASKKIKCTPDIQHHVRVNLSKIQYHA